MQDENKLKKVARMISDLDLGSFDDLPDLGLYMDQVTGYLNRRLSPFLLGREEITLTPNMINNYVKSGHISRPMQKKYSREQIAALYMLCSLKKNLSIPDAAALIYFLTQQNGPREAYDRFLTVQKRATTKTAEEVLAIRDTEDERELTDLVLELTLSSYAERLAAEALISLLIKRDDERNADARRRAEAEQAQRAAEDRAKREEKKAKKAARKQDNAEKAEEK